MINDFIKRLLKWSFIAVCWVFVLSITVAGKTLFSHANEVLVQNRFVHLVDEQLGEFWFKLFYIVEVTYNNLGEKTEEERQKAKQY